MERLQANCLFRVAIQKSGVVSFVTFFKIATSISTAKMDSKKTKYFKCFYLSMTILLYDGSCFN